MTEFEDPDKLGTYLKKSRRSRRWIGALAAFSLLVALFALLVAGAVLVQQQNLVAGCQRSHERDRDMARLALSSGSSELRERALRRASGDCGQQFSLLP